jgi:hypothetical protein
MDNEYNTTWDYCVFAGVQERSLAGAPRWHLAPSPGVQGALYYGDNSNNGHGVTSSTGYKYGGVPYPHNLYGPVESPSMASPAWVSTGWYGGSTGYNNGVVPQPYSRHGPVENPPMASPFGGSTGWVGSSSSWNTFAPPYQPWHSGGNSYNAQPRAVVGSGRAPRVQLGGDAASRETAERVMSDPRHGTVAPKDRRERKKLTRQVKKAEAAKTAVVRSETGGDGVTSSPEREGEEKEEGAGHAGYDIASGHVESQGLGESCLIRDDQADARRKASFDERASAGKQNVSGPLRIWGPGVTFLVSAPWGARSGSGCSNRKAVNFKCLDELQPAEEAVCEDPECDLCSEASTDMSRTDSFEPQDKVDDLSIESQQEDVVPRRMRSLSFDWMRERSPSNAHSSGAEEAEAAFISCALSAPRRPFYFGEMRIDWDCSISCLYQDGNGWPPHFAQALPAREQH